MMLTYKRILAALFLGLVATLNTQSVSQADVFTSSGDFLANVAAGSYFEDFASAVPGLSPALNFSGGSGFAYTVDASTPDNLFNDTGLISTNFAADQIIITFTGADVTAVGGNFWSTDISVAAIPANVTVSLSDGTNETFASSASSDYRGFTSNVPITSLSIDAADDVNTSWATLDNLTVGTVVPEPATMSMLALAMAGLAIARRR